MYKEKRTLQHGWSPKVYQPRFRFLAQRRTRYLILAVFILGLVYHYLPVPLPLPLVITPPSRRKPGISEYKIQATFPSESPIARAIRLDRQRQVKEAFTHAWKGYKTHAWLHDEVAPLSGGFKDPYVGWAATLVDSLDTLWIMGLKDEFENALRALQNIDFRKPKAERVPVFETTIRYLGGMLGAYDVSEQQYPILLAKASELGDFLFAAFRTQSGLPAPYYFWEADNTELLDGEDRVLFAQVASLSMEFIRLSQLTGDMRYSKAIQKVTDLLQKKQNTTSLPGMWPSQVNFKDGPVEFRSTSFTLGAWADSAFEYLPKTHLLLSPDSTRNTQYLDMYQFASSAFTKHLFFRPDLPSAPDILFSGTFNAMTMNLHPLVEHLGCFVGGMVGLASKITQNITELTIAEKITNGCVWAYDNTPSKIMPETFNLEACPTFEPCLDDNPKAGIKVIDTSYQLRPEAIESVFVMYRLTADPDWMEKAWRMFSAIQSQTKTKIANARIRNVMTDEVELLDSMESFWLAETLKYFYLIFSEDLLVSLDDFVLNTEAHPFRWGAW